MKVLVVNSGSSSVKYELFDMTGPWSIASGIVECIGEPLGRSRHLIRSAGGETNETVCEQRFANHGEALLAITTSISESGLLRDPTDLAGIGHRVVHGGEKFCEPTLLNDNVIATVREQSSLAPLHNPANLIGIQETLRMFPHVPQVAVFDTAFHQTIPPHAYLYAIPYEYYSRLGVRRYGFHGTSHRYVANAAADHLGRSLESLRLVTIHLGNGASAAAILRGMCVDTSMGMTPLEGLMMGTRSGDIDPAILPFLAKQEGMAIDEVDAMLNQQSGLKGICGANDMREILQRAEEGDARAQLAIEMYTYRIKKYVGAYLAVLGGADAIVFTGGIGENAQQIREAVCAGMVGFGIAVDGELNATKRRGVFEIQTQASKVRVLVVPTNEELEIARQTMACIVTKQQGLDQ